jgi:CheY-like chemotaxis protein
MAYILFADDEQDAVQIAAAYLTGRGHWCVVVRNGLDALAQISEQVPDILVTDLMLPGVDGLWVLQEFWRQYPDNRTGVILLTTIQADGEPLRTLDKDWPIDSFVLRHRTVRTFAWQIVLAVEQLLNPRIRSEPSPNRRS